MKNFTLELSYNFSLEQTLESGQCFRWKGERGSYTGIVGDKPLLVSQTDERTLVFHDTSQSDFENFWKGYFDLERDYEALKEIFSRDATLKKAVEFCGGIRVLNQPRWEALCSYIVSQNNNIVRIQSLIEKMCAQFGKPVHLGSNRLFSFPSAEILAGASQRDFEKMGFGYRAPYIVATARAVASGEVCLDKVAALPVSEARDELLKLKGVGEKVANCTLVYGFGKTDAFPVDTWIRKTMNEFYPNGLPDFIKPHAGVAQIYLFHYARKMSRGL